VDLVEVVNNAMHRVENRPVRVVLAATVLHQTAGVLCLPHPRRNEQIASYARRICARRIRAEGAAEASRSLIRGWGAPGPSGGKPAHLRKVRHRTRCPGSTARSNSRLRCSAERSGDSCRRVLHRFPVLSCPVKLVTRGISAP
jgi:hypothetical protein